MSMKFLKTVAGAAVSSLWEKVSGNIVPKDTDADVGIQITDPEAPLGFSAAEADNVKIRFQNTHSVTGDAGISTYDDTAGTDLIIGSNLYINSAGNLARWNTSEQSSYSYAGRDGAYLIGTGGTGAVGTTRIKVESGGDVIISTGNLVIGTAGKGIDFSAQTATTTGTTTAELLDHYEAGTWTAAFAAGSGTVTIDSGTNTGGYTRIGRQVHVQGYFSITSVSSPSGTFDLTGLPFTVGTLSKGADYGAITMRMGTVNGTMGDPMGIIFAGVSYLRLEEFTGTAAAHIADHMQAGTVITISATYFV